MTRGLVSSVSILACQKGVDAGRRGEKRQGGTQNGQIGRRGERRGAKSAARGGLEERS